MSTTVQTYFDNADLALAAYSDFSGIARGPSGALVENEVQKQLTKTGSLLPWSDKTSDFSDTQATDFLTRYEVLDQYSTDDLPPVAVPIIRQEVRLQG